VGRLVSSELLLAEFDALDALLELPELALDELLDEVDPAGAVAPAEACALELASLAPVP
jgi:hypothetical protein